VILKLDSHLQERFPGLRVLTRQIEGVKVEKQSKGLEDFKDELMKRVRERYDLESLRDLPAFRAYRDFFWRAGIDPTKNRPAAEALIRRILQGRPLPRVNTLVDAYNLASVQTEVALAAFDAERLRGDLLMRFATGGEEFTGIGMEGPVALRGGEVVVSDGAGLVAVYPHRDAERTKVAEATRSVLLLVCGVPGIPEETLADAARVAVEYITHFCGGEEKASRVEGAHSKPRTS